MSKPTKTSLGIANPSSGYGYVTDSEMPNRLVGKILEVIEALGLPEKQEEATKSLVRKSIWENWEGYCAISITPETHDKIVALYREARNKAGEFPVMAI